MGRHGVRFLWATILSSIPALSFSEEISTDALRQITETAAAICGEFEREGFKNSTEIEGKINAEVAGLLNKLVDVGVEGAAQLNSSEYAGLLQEDLESDRLDVRNCKKEIFSKLFEGLSRPDPNPARFEISEPPTVNGRTIDGCIRSPQFPEFQGLACVESAQKTIADEFCKGAGFLYSEQFYARDTGQFQASYKFVEEIDAGGKLSRKWVIDNTGAFIFTKIGCRS